MKHSLKDAEMALVGAKLSIAVVHIVGAFVVFGSLALFYNGSYIAAFFVTAIGTYMAYRQSGTQMFAKRLQEEIDKVKKKK